MIGNYVLKQHQLGLVEEYYEHPFIGVINWQANNLEINGFALWDHCKSAVSFFSPKEIRIKVWNCKTLYSIPMKTVGLIPALFALKYCVACKCQE